MGPGGPATLAIANRLDTNITADRTLLGAQLTLNSLVIYPTRTSYSST